MDSKTMTAHITSLHSEHGIRRSPRIEAFGIDVPAEAVLGDLKRRLGGTPSRRVQNQSRRVVEKLSDTMTPAAVCRLLPVVHTDNNVSLGRKPLRSAKIGSVVGRCHQAAVFALTLGSRVDRIMRESAHKGAHYTYMVDTAATSAAELAANRLRTIVQRRLPADLGTTDRFSPGYCDWSITEQRPLFELLAGNPLGIHLSESCLMTPRKSIAGVMGIGPRTRVRRYENACIDCGNPRCTFRRSPKGTNAS